jgi:hypothetical protein
MEGFLSCYACRAGVWARKSCEGPGLRLTFGSSPRPIPVLSPCELTSPAEFPCAWRAESGEPKGAVLALGRIAAFAWRSAISQRESDS